MAQGDGKPCQGSLRGPQPSEKVGRAWEQCSGWRGGGGDWDSRQEHGQEATGKPPMRRERGEARPFLQFGFCFDPCCSEARRHPPTTGMSAALAQVRLRWEPDRRLALHGSQEIAAIDSNREAAAGSVFTATNRACSAVSRQERHPARLGSCWQPLPLFELMG